MTVPAGICSVSDENEPGAVTIVGSSAYPMDEQTRGGTWGQNEGGRSTATCCCERA